MSAIKWQKLKLTLKGCWCLHFICHLLGIHCENMNAHVRKIKRRRGKKVGITRVDQIGQELQERSKSISEPSAWVLTWTCQIVLSHACLIAWHLLFLCYLLEPTKQVPETSLTCPWTIDQALRTSTLSDLKQALFQHTRILQRLPSTIILHVNIPPLCPCCLDLLDQILGNCATLESVHMQLLDHRAQLTSQALPFPFPPFPSARSSRGHSWQETWVGDVSRLLRGLGGGPQGSCAVGQQFQGGRGEAVMA